MKEVVIIEAVRTPIGRFRGSLAGVRADHLGSIVIAELIRRTGVDVGLVEDVIFGCVTQVGEQCGNIARSALLGAGWPVSIPGMTLDRKCGSGEVAVHTAVGAISCGAADIVVAGGAENMSRVPMGGNRDVHGEVFGALLRQRYDLVSQGEAAERIVDQWKLTRSDLDKFAVESHRRAAAAAQAGWFDREIVAVPVGDPHGEGSASATANPPTLFSRDETIRSDTRLEKLATLKTSFRPETGRLTAGNASQISDGAAALLLMSGDRARTLGLRPRARIVAFTTVGSDPCLMLTGPIAATRKVLEKAGLSLAEIDLFEVNEAFAPVPLIWMQELGVAQDRVNVNGGAIALGHPLGATGARIMTSLLYELERRHARFGLQTICCAGGMGTATIIERL